MFGKLKTKSDFFAGKMLLCDMPFSSIFLLNNYERSGSWPNMFLFVVGTHTKCVINEFALDARTDILIFPCDTVTNGIDLRRSPLRHSPNQISLILVFANFLGWVGTV